MENNLKDLSLLELGSVVQLLGTLHYEGQFSSKELIERIAPIKAELQRRDDEVVKLKEDLKYALAMLTR